MIKPEWGTKRICPKCGTRFYDLKRDPIVCPKCQAPYEPEAEVKGRRLRATAPSDAPPAAVSVVAPAAAKGEADEAEIAEVEEVEEVATASEGEDFIEDASELGEDEDDMAEVIEGIPEDEDER